MKITNQKIHLYKIHLKNSTMKTQHKHSSFSTRKFFLTFLSSILLLNTLSSNTLTVHASSLAEQAEARKYSPIESDNYTNWPAGPQISSESAILMEANTGAILYEKNIHKKQSPASTTKILTGLIASENSELDEIVHFSYDAVFNLESGSSNMGMSDGQAISMEEALYGIFVYSANETSNAIAEHIAGSNEEFSKLMNEKAKSLGALNSNFINPHGLYDENHYTTAYDFALIANEFFKNKTLCKMSSTLTYTVPESPTQPNENCYLVSHNRLLEGQRYAYESLLGSKTGYTDVARQTLVSAATRDGITLICVVFNDESPGQFKNTIELFDYGFNNFQAVPISDNEDNYTLDGADSFSSELDVFGDSNSILSLNDTDYIILPTTAIFEDVESTIAYNNDSDSSIATINYTYYDTPVGNASIDLNTRAESSFDFEETTSANAGVDNSSLESESATNEPVESGEPTTSDSLENEQDLIDSSLENEADESNTVAEEESEDIIFINVVKVLLWGILIVGTLIFIIYVRALINSYHFNKRRRARIAKRKRSIHRGEFDDFDFD